MPRLVKKDFIIEISNKTGLTHQDVSTVLESFLDGVMDHLGSGNAVALRDFGTFDLRVSRRKLGRNPRQPEKTIPIPDKHIVRFRPSGKFEEVAAAVPVPE